jgi:hypothetical protein
VKVTVLGDVTPYSLVYFSTSLHKVLYMSIKTTRRHMQEDGNFHNQCVTLNYSKNPLNMFECAYKIKFWKAECVNQF